MTPAFRAFTSGVALIVLAGCADLPVAGPLTSEVVKNNRSSAAHIDYVVMDVTQLVCDILSRTAAQSFAGTFGGTGRPAEYAIGAGDTLAVTIWETGPGALFSNPTPVTQPAPASRGVTLPDIVVAQDGAVTIPYAGRLQVEGRTPAEAERAIIDALRGKTVDPQVLVRIAHVVENSVTVGGEVVSGARVPLSVTGDHILDVIAAGGGVKAPVNEAVIRLTRGATTVSIPFWVVVQHPEENIYLRPGDTVTVVRSPQTFTAFGAVGRNFQIAFEADTITAQEAIGKAGGLLDQRADPAGMFVLRFKSSATIRAMAPGQTLPAGDALPVVYRLDMRDAGAYFLARQFTIRDKDILYVANAPLNEVQKVLGIIGAALGPAATTAAVGTSVYSLTR